MQELRDAYDSCLRYLDEQVALLVTELEDRGLLANTLLIITSDHGEQFGEHDLILHGNSLYMPLLHVPLLMFLPSRIPAGIKIPAPVSLRNLPASIMDLIGVRSNFRFPGESLARTWTSETMSVPLMMLYWLRIFVPGPTQPGILECEETCDPSPVSGGISSSMTATGRKSSLT